MNKEQPHNLRATSMPKRLLNLPAACRRFLHFQLSLAASPIVDHISPDYPGVGPAFASVSAKLGVGIPMTNRVSLYPVVLSGGFCLLMAGAASADIKDPLSADGTGQQTQTIDATEVVSQGMRSMTGDMFSQGMQVQSGPWAGEIYSQGMQMSTGDIYSQGMRITFLGTSPTPPPQPSSSSPQPPSPSPQPLSEGCAGTASNCTDNVTNTPTSSDPPSNQAANMPAAVAGLIATASADPVPEPASLALLGSTLLWFGVLRYRRKRV